MALVTASEVKSYLGLSDSQLRIQGLRVLVEPGPVSATVQVKSTDIEFIIVGGANPGTYTWDLTDPLYATLTLLAAAMNASVADITCEALAPGASDSNDLVPTSATACIGEANAQTLSITDNYLLSQIADRISSMAENYCQIDYEDATISERHDGGGGSLLMLDNRPVNYVSRIAVSPVTGISITNTLSTATGAYVAVSATTLTLTVEVGAGTTTSTLTLATYGTITLLAAAINALSAAGWAATVVSPYAGHDPADLIVMETSYVLDTAVSLELFVGGESDYILYPDKGWIVLKSGVFSPGYRNVVVTYNHGYAVIPGALKERVLQLISFVYYQSRTDPTLQSERLGDHSWSRATGVITTNSFNNMLESSLALWRRFDIVVT